MNKQDKAYSLTISHLYPDKMNLYGDLGNVITLKKRAEARGVKIIVKNISEKSQLKAGQTDIYFFGGGQDSQQVEIATDLVKKKAKALLEDLNNNVPILAICGGYQLLGKYYLTSTGEKAEGVGFFPIETVSPGKEVKQRCIGNISGEIVNNQTLKDIEKYYSYKIGKKLLKTAVGFENHSGRTKLLSKKPLQLIKVKTGVGDAEGGGFEGLRYKNAFGSYMHGSFLPKNPHIADVILSLALKNKYKQKFTELEPLDDKLEWQAHEAALKLM